MSAKGTATKIVAGFQTRDFSLPLLPPVTLLPQRYSFNAMGGPREAVLDGVGDPDDLWRCIDLIRCPVVLYDENAKAVWWGYVANVEVSTGAYTFGLSLDTMANRIAVAYTRIEAGQSTSTTRSTTLWAQDDTSVEEFGIKEALLTLANATDSAADRYRDAGLSLGKVPVPIFTVGEGGSSRVTLTCRGWWDTLRWRYPALLPDGIAYVPDGTTTYESEGVIMFQSGNFSSQRIIAQPFLTGTYGYRLDSIEIRAKKVGNPPPLRIAVYTSTVPGPSGVIQDLVGYVDLDASEATTDFQWYERGIYVNLAPSTYYFITTKLAASQTLYTPTDHWVVGIDTVPEIYPDYVAIRYYPDNTWATYTNTHLEVRTNGSRMTAQLISDIVSQVGEFLNGATWDQSTFIYEAAYADGDTNAEEIVMSIMQLGSDVSPRLLGTVDVQRTLFLYPEPQGGTSTSTPQFMVSGDGQFYTGLGAPIPSHWCPCGGWLELKDIIPAFTHTNKLLSPMRIFIEESEYNVSSGRVSITPRGLPTVWDLGGGS